MAKISKPLLKLHYEALELLKKDKLTFTEVEFIYENYHEGVNKANNLISAHFTPYELAHSMSFNIAYPNCFVDLCAGIGVLSYALERQHTLGYDNTKLFGICIERCTEYYEVGKKLLPNFHWINGDIFDKNVIAEVKRLLNGRKFSVISNPPYGNQVKAETKDLLKYSGNRFEYKAIELGYELGAYDGAFLIPQNSCPFRMTGQRGNVYSEKYKDREYLKFVKQTELEIRANMGYSTELSGDYKGWKDVSITTEIAIMEYDEQREALEPQEEEEEVTPIQVETENQQMTLF